MAGKYYKTYLSDRVMDALDKALQEKGQSAYSFLAEAVKAKLEAEGFLVVRRITPSAELASAGERGTVRRGRRRRA
jgi:ribosomal protein S12 methylthiotransferase accessory factor YcaO